ncbi:MULTISPECIES: helix-turn-helix transcriptional regulator [Nocardia]|uniref:Transcriptional regulator n=1 Tax=Nocardia sputorum TaxID=2984338 RepID=A0ABN6U509_9NOCA|nr:helix-turn-helix transcriptional regulator [Nocardia sputorum]BDT91805.1 transcriptional regulator [Nocardia sputorum]BDU00334.1 transcriptional regulator [Nocardia sputorum]
MTSEAVPRRRELLRDFLRARRARLSPEDVGIPATGRRRTPGLRREEVAVLAGVGVSWYTWLEQGRVITVSDEVLDAIARVLLLSEPERIHLYLLAGLNPPPLECAPGTAVTPEVQQLIDAWDGRPAVLRDRYWNVLTFNETARVVFGYGDGEHNCLLTYFTNPRYRAMDEIWAENAPAIVAAYRASAAICPGDADFRKVVDDLRSVSAEFAELWERQEVGVPAQAVNALRHPDLGELFFDATTLTVADHPEWQLVLYNPRPETATAQRLERLHRLRVASPA